MTARFTNRTGGVSHGAFASLNLGTHVGDDLEDVLRNREIVREKFGPTQYMYQVHGDRIAIMTFQQHRLVIAALRSLGTAEATQAINRLQAAINARRVLVLPR